MEKITTRALRRMKEEGEKIAVLTCYDAASARLLNEQSVEVLLVGDSVANVKLGYDTTLPVSLQEMSHHVRAVRRGNGRALLVADMPFLTYESDPREAVRNAGKLVKAGAEAVKLEGAAPLVLKAVRALSAAGVAVMGHLGLTPQSVHKLGGYRVQGRGAGAARKMLFDARALERAGVFAVVLEAVPSALARRLTRALKVPTIGIGAGPHCDGQVLVLDDLLGLTPAPRPRFVRAYAELRAAAARAVGAWRRDVKSGRFPGLDQSYA